MNDLPLQIRQRHAVVIDNAERANARRRQILQHRRTEPAGANDKHTGALQLLLAGPAHLAKDDMAGITLDFGRGEGRDLLFGHDAVLSLPLWERKDFLGFSLFAKSLEKPSEGVV